MARKPHTKFKVYFRQGRPVRIARVQTKNGKAQVGFGLPDSSIENPEARNQSLYREFLAMGAPERPAGE